MLSQLAGQGPLSRGLRNAACLHVFISSSAAALKERLHLQVEHLQEEEPAAVMASAKVIYSAGFFITACGEAVIAAAEHCLANSKTYAVVRSPKSCPAAEACHECDIGRC